MTPNRDPFQLTLPLKLRSEDEAFIAGLKIGHAKAVSAQNITDKRFYEPKLNENTLNVALQEFQRAH